MRHIFITIIGLLFYSTVLAFGYKIVVELPKAAGNQVILAHYYTSQILINDSIRLDSRGRGEFKADTLLPQGLYKIYFNNENHFDFLLSSDQDFTISNSGFSNSSIKIKGATESEEFAGYIQFLSGQQAKRREIEEKQKSATPELQEVYQKKIDTLTDELYAYWKSETGRFPGTWLATFLMANYVPLPDEDKIPVEIKNNDTLLLRYKFDFQKQHYFDYFDVGDVRLLYTPLIKPKIENYFARVLLQVYDSVRVGTLALIEKSRLCKPMFRYLVSYFLNESINSKLMGMDGLFVDIAKNYYLSGQAYWADSTILARIRENVIFSEHNLIGMEAPELKLQGIEGEEYFSLHQVNAKITLLLIYEPNCSHCMEFVPALHKEVYQAYKNKGLAVYAIYSMDNKKEWEDFVIKHDLFDWINVWDPHNFSDFKVIYDARKTPAIYVLDKDKKIIAKKLTVEQIAKILEIELK